MLALMLTAMLTACGTDSSSGGGGNGDSLTEPGFSLRLTDAAFDDATRVEVTFVEVGLKKASGGWVDIPVVPAQKIDLAALQGTKTADLLLDVDIEAGDYTELRLIVDTTIMANSIELSAGGQFDLTIPSGGTAGLNIKGDFTVSATRPTSLIVDVDLRQSIVVAGANFMLKPVLRLIKGDNFGHIRGMVDPALLTAASCSDALVDTFNAVYVYDGHRVVPDDIDQLSTTDIDPVTTSKIVYDAGASEYIYEAAFLPAGDYTIAFTCNVDLEDLNADDNLQFFGIQKVTVQVNDTTFL